MGLFKSIKKTFKKFALGVKKVFKPITKAFSKLMQNKAFKTIMMVAAVVTGGIAIYGGIMGAMGAAGTQAWSTLSLSSKFVVGAKAFVGGAQAAVGSAMGTVKGALGIQGASGGAGITASATQAGAGTAQGAFAAANPELAKLGVDLSAKATGTSSNALANLGSTGLQTGELGSQSVANSVGSVNGSGLTDAVAATEGAGGASTAAQNMIASPSPFQLNTGSMGGYSGGSGMGSQVFDGAYKVAQTVGDAANAADGKGGLLSQAGSFLSGGGGAVAMMGGQALSGMAQAKMQADAQQEALDRAEEDEKSNWYNHVSAGELNVGGFRAPQGLLAGMQQGGQQVYDRAQAGYQNIQQRAQDVRQQYGYA